MFITLTDDNGRVIINTEYILGAYNSQLQGNNPTSLKYEGTVILMSNGHTLVVKESLDKISELLGNKQKRDSVLGIKLASVPYNGNGTKVRLLNGLRGLGYDIDTITIGELLDIPSFNLAKTRNMGKTTIQRMKDFLYEEYGVEWK